jgi:hypothetical protein
MTQSVVRVSGALWRILLNPWGAGSQKGERQSSDIIDKHVKQLLDEFKRQRNGLTVVDSAREAFALLGRIPHLLRWDEGLGEAHRDLMLATIYQAERFGDNSGPLKRRFALDLMTRVLRRYNQDGLPFIQPIEDAFVKPFLGVALDWCVATLNTHNTWPAVGKVTIPRLYKGRTGRILWLGLQLLRVWVKLRELFFYPSKYERQVRDAFKKLQPEVNEFVRVLPPARLHDLIEQLANIINDVGKLTAPHLRTIDSLLRLSSELRDLDPDKRREAVVRIMQELLRRAYADNAFALSFVDSIFGEFFIREMVASTESVLARNGLLPTSRPSRSQSQSVTT